MSGQGVACDCVWGTLDLLCLECVVSGAVEDATVQLCRCTGVQLYRCIGVQTCQVKLRVWGMVQEETTKQH